MGETDLQLITPGAVSRPERRPRSNLLTPIIHGQHIISAQTPSNRSNNAKRGYVRFMLDNGWAARVYLNSPLNTLRKYRRGFPISIISIQCLM
jgi:hypothetical protein